METCPNCGKHNEVDANICECGQRLVAINDHRNTWETETVFSGQPKEGFRRILVLSIGLALAGAFVILAWSKIRERLYQPDDTASVRSNAPAANGPNSGNSEHSNNTLVAKVISVPDGQTVTVVVDEQQAEFHVRLSGIDAPPLTDSFGEQAKEYLASLISGKTVWIEPQKTADNGIIYGKVLSEGRNINLEQVRAGYARLSDNLTDFLTLEEMDSFRQSEVTARTNRVGLWVQTDVGIMNAADQSGVFAISSSARSNHPLSKGSPMAIANFGTTPAIENTNAAQLTKKSETLQNQNDCKPDITVALKRPEPSEPADAKLAIKANDAARTYILGPRGGCFFVTSGGSKRYVDHSLCSPVSAIGIH